MCGYMLNVIKLLYYRRRSLKQAQLTLHQELQPYTHQKPILRTILCTAVEEIKVRPQHRTVVSELLISYSTVVLYIRDN